MAFLFPPLFAFLIGTLVSGLELITSKYPRTFFLIKKSWAFGVYATVYGLISFLVMLLLKSLVEGQYVKLEGFAISNTMVQAFVIGVSTKALLHMRLFQVTTGSQNFPVGIETLIYLFEPLLLNTLVIDEFNALKEYIRTAKNKYPVLQDAKTSIRANIPPNLTKADRAGFLADLDEKQTVEEVMELYLRNFGRKSFNRIFPL